MAGKKLLSGNEAIALGAWEAGVAVGCGYPGTPSTEIIEALHELPDVYTQWSVNEKVALEVGIGAALAGGRALVTMKHVGVNVAADPLFTAIYTGTNAGLVVITADDPSMHSSQNEQDNRHYALAAKAPMFEPADSAEARQYTKWAFEFSEEFDTPVFLRTTTRLSHSKGVVADVDLDAKPARHPVGFHRNAAKYVMIPANARVQRVDLADRLRRQELAVESHPANRVETADHNPDRVGVITSGVPYTYVKEVLPHADVLKLGIVNPLPMNMIRTFAADHDTVYVIEELDPIIETQLKAAGIDCIGKEVFPDIGEFNPESLRRCLGLPEQATIVHDVDVPRRIPGLCAGCPHGTVYDELRDRGMIVSGDIGCYTLGGLPPYSVLDTCIDMGASITVAQGMDAVYGDAAERPMIAAVIGDSTFCHSGMTGLLNACWNKHDGLYVVLDNGTTAMTGTQPNPSSGERIGHENAMVLDYRLLAKAFGIPDENVAIVDVHDRQAIHEALDDLTERTGVRLLVTMGLCVMEAKELHKIGKLDEKKAWRELELQPVCNSGGRAND